MEKTCHEPNKTPKFYVHVNEIDKMLFMSLHIGGVCVFVSDVTIDRSPFCRYKSLIPVKGERDGLSSQNTPSTVSLYIVFS